MMVKHSACFKNWHFPHRYHEFVNRAAHLGYLRQERPAYLSYRSRIDSSLQHIATTEQLISQILCERGLFKPLLHQFLIAAA